MHAAGDIAVALRGGRFATAFRKLHGIPEQLPNDRHVGGVHDLERAADMFVWERGFSWRQSGLRVLQLQVLGFTLYALCLLLGAPLPGVVILLSTTAWSLLHTRLQTRDMRQCRTARDENSLLTGLFAVGGFGGLPAPYARELLTETTSPEAVDLRDAGRSWAAQHLGDPAVKETFLSLAPEFDGTAADLLTTCVGLLTT